MKSKLEYIWLDGYTPTQSLRSKTMVRNDFGGTLEECPMWSFDGSSTEQAEGNASDCLLKPVAIIPDPDRKNAYLVMTEVLNADGTRQPTHEEVVELKTQYGVRVAVAVSEYEKIKAMAKNGKEPEFRGHLPKDREVIRHLLDCIDQGNP